jgi:hypothetical protein
MTPDRSSHPLLTPSRTTTRLANMALWQSAVAFVVYLGLSAGVPTVDTLPIEPPPASCSSESCVIYLDADRARQ